MSWPRWSLAGTAAPNVLLCSQPPTYEFPRASAPRKTGTFYPIWTNDEFFLIHNSKNISSGLEENWRNLYDLKLTVLDYCNEYELCTNMTFLDGVQVISIRQAHLLEIWGHVAMRARCREGKGGLSWNVTSDHPGLGGYLIWEIGVGKEISS